ncbi:MAG: hypothetical protein LBJ32_03310 [Oscillospiraceae bacterium]|jgi:hypothetical protein|nr:hypothetical protein [Oscillospiraceae bacterium]
MNNNYLKGKEKMKKAFLKAFSVFLAFQIPVVHNMVEAAPKNSNSKNIDLNINSKTVSKELKDYINSKTVLRELRYLVDDNKKNKNSSNFFDLLASFTVGITSGSILTHYNMKKSDKENFAVALTSSLKELFSTSIQSPEWYEKAQNVQNVFLQLDLNDKNLKNEVSGLLEAIQKTQKESLDFQLENGNINATLNNQIQNFENLKEELYNAKKTLEEVKISNSFLEQQINVSNENLTKMKTNLENTKQENDDLKNQNKILLESKVKSEEKIQSLELKIIEASAFTDERLKTLKVSGRLKRSKNFQTILEEYGFLMSSFEGLNSFCIKQVEQIEELTKRLEQKS